MSSAPAQQRRLGARRGGSPARSRRRSRLRVDRRPTGRPMGTPRAAGRVGIGETTAPQAWRTGRDGHGVPVAGTRAARGSGRSSRQPGAALEPTGLEDRPAGTSPHPGAEAVLAGTPAGVRLEGALHEAPDMLGSTRVATAARPSIAVTRTATGRRPSGRPAAGYGTAPVAGTRPAGDVLGPAPAGRSRLVTSVTTLCERCVLASASDRRDDLSTAVDNRVDLAGSEGRRCR